MRDAIAGACLEHSLLRTVAGGTPLGGGAYTRTLTEPSIEENISLTLRAKNDRAIYRMDGRFKAQR